MSGLAANSGRKGDLPTPLGTAVVDASTALMFALHIMIALYHRRMTGQGQKVEVSLFNTAIAVQCQELAAFNNLGVRWDRSETGIAQAWLAAPYGIYPTKDGYIAIAMASLAQLGDLLDLPEIKQYDEPEAAFQHRDEVKRLMEQRTAAFTTNEIIDKLLAADVWAAPVQDFDDLLDDPQVKHNEMFIDVQHPDAGNLRLVGHPGKLSATPGTVRYPPPRVGEHTDQVLQELGFDTGRIADLRAKGAIG